MSLFTRSAGVDEVNKLEDTEEGEVESGREGGSRVSMCVYFLFFASIAIALIVSMCFVFVSSVSCIEILVYFVRR